MLNDAGVVAAAPATDSVNFGVASQGKAIFDVACAHCDSPDAVVADPEINLRLLQRKHGEQMDEVFRTTVTNGRPTKGMPTWKEVYKPADFADILAWLKTVQDR